MKQLTSKQRTMLALFANFITAENSYKYDRKGFYYELGDALLSQDWNKFKGGMYKRDFRQIILCVQHCQAECCLNKISTFHAYKPMVVSEIGDYEITWFGGNWIAGSFIKGDWYWQEQAHRQLA